MKLLRDTWLVFGRYFGLFIRNPVWVVIGVAAAAALPRPVRAAAQAARAHARLPAGRRLQRVRARVCSCSSGMFGAAGVGFSLIAELRMGVIERLRVTPVSRVALLLGRALRDMLSILVQSLILILIALPFGLSIHPVGVVVVLALIALIGLLTASIAYAVALWLRERRQLRADRLHLDAADPAALRRAAAAWASLRSGCRTSPP